MPNNLENNDAWIDQEYRTIRIKGGTDATNASLISWLETNAVQQEDRDAQMLDVAQLESDLTDVADSVRAQTKISNLLAFPNDFQSQLDSLPASYKLNLATLHLTNGSKVGDNKIVEGGITKIQIIPQNGYVPPQSTNIKATGATSSYFAPSGIITLSNPTARVQFDSNASYGCVEATATTVTTSTVPQSLTQSVGAFISKLEQTGVCVQNGTPAPSAPVAIKCNNGSIVLKDAELPYGYKRLASITFSASTYYNTNKKLYGSDVVTMTISDFTSGGQNLFGCYAGTSDDVYNFSLYIYGTSTGQAYWRYGQTLYRPVVGSTSQRTITFGAGGTTGFKTNVTDNTVDFETTSVAWIGALPNSSSPKYEGKIIGNVTIGTRLKYIPCERVSDGVIGYYEAVEGVFLEPQGSAPTKGAYDDTYLAAGATGTPEVLSIGSKNLNAGDLDHVGYTSTGGTSRSDTFAGTLCQIPTKEGEKFTVSCGNIEGGISGVFINTWLEDGSWNTRQAIAATGGTLTYTVGAGVGLINFTLYKTGGVELSNNSWMQVEYGATATSHVSYATPQTASVADLFAVGNYKDTQDIITGDITRKVGIKVFDGTESVSASGEGWAIAISDKLKSKLDVLCSHYPYSSATMANAPDKSIVSFASQNIGIKDSSFASESDVQTFLAAQYAAGTPVMVVYPLAEETANRVVPQRLYTFYNGSVISVTVEVDNIPLSATYSQLVSTS